MQLQSAPFRNIAEVRSAFEPMTSALAATPMSDDSLTELRSAVEQMRGERDDQDSFLDANERFHDIVAWGSGNTLFGYIIESLLGIMDGTRTGIDHPGYRRQAIHKAHEEILVALESRDPEASEARMRENIDAYERYAERKFPQFMADTLPWDQRYFG